MYDNSIYMMKKKKKGSFLYGDKHSKMKMTVVEEQINQEDLKDEEEKEDEKENEKENEKDNNIYTTKNTKNRKSSGTMSNKEDDKVMNFSFGKQRIGSKKRTETFSQSNEGNENNRNDQSKNKDKFSKTNESGNNKSENKSGSSYTTPDGEMNEIDEEDNESSKNDEESKSKKYYNSEEEESEDEENEEEDDYNNYNTRDRDMNTVSEVEENEFYDDPRQYESRNYNDYGDNSASNNSEKESMEDFPNMMNIFKEDPNKEKREREEQKRILEITEAFNLFDKDCDGNIDIRELATVMRTLGYNPNKEELDDIIKTFDEDESGTIDKEEFINLLSTKMKEQKEDKDLLEIFNVFDKNKDGFITEDDINYVIDEIGDDLDEDIISELIAKGDEDNDGRINFIEFKKIFIGKKK